MSKPVVQWVNIQAGVSDLFINGQLIIIARCQVGHYKTLQAKAKDWIDIFETEGKEVIIEHNQQNGYKVTWRLNNKFFNRVSLITPQAA